MKFRTLLAAGALVGAAAALGTSQVQRLDLETMVSLTDNAIYGEIVSKRAFVIDEHPRHGTDLFFTVLTIEGQSMRDGRKITVDVCYPGGFVSETRGVWNSEAPSDDDTQVGNKIVAFYGWLDDMGGCSGNRLWASHGGLFRTVEGPNGVTVLGRGDGYAVRYNMKVKDLEVGVRNIARELDRKKAEELK